MDPTTRYLGLTAAQRRRIAFDLAPSVTPITDERFDDDDVARGCVYAAQRHPGLRVYLLADDAIATPENVTRLRSIDEADDGAAVFILAIADDRRLAAVAAELQRRPGARYYGPPVYYPTARYAHRDPIARRVLLDEAALDAPKFNLDDFEGLMQALAVTRRIEGAFVEIGVYQGRSARAAIRYMREAGIERDTLLADTFEGFSYAEASESADAVWHGTHLGTDPDAVRAFVEADDRVEVRRLNIITDDLPARYDPIAVCNIDVDMYEAVLAAARRVAPRVPVGGVIVFEDAGHTPALAGALAATNAFLESDAAARFTPIYLRSGQTLAVRVAP